MLKVAPWQIRFPKEAQLVGAILAGYGELEFAALRSKSTISDDDQGQGVKYIRRCSGALAIE